MRAFSIIALLGAVLMGVAGLAWGDRSETIFREALDYTTQIRTVVANPFEGDLKGTLRGAGFVVDARRGWVMTNAHVVARSPSRVEVAPHGARFVAARKVYVDSHLDLAIVELPEESRAGLAAANLNCDDIPGVGHPVGAFGHPWNLRFTGTRGIISGVAARDSRELLQTDAPINEGNSGGPLISLDTGRIVAINTAQIQGSQNTNFAVAMKYACRVLRLLQAGVDPSPPALSVVYFRESEDEKTLKVARNYAPQGLGLRAGDVIRGVVGVPGPIENETQLFHLLRGRVDQFSLVVSRGGAETIVSGKAEPAHQIADLRGLTAGGVFFGATPLRDAAEVRVGEIMVHYVERGSDGQAKELQRGDFVEAVDGDSVDTLQQLELKLSAARAAGRPVTLVLKRYGGGNRVFVYLERSLAADRIERVGNWDGPQPNVAQSPATVQAPLPQPDQQDGRSL